MTCTELGMLSKLSEEFEERNCKLLAIGVDTKLGHKAFIKEIQVLLYCKYQLVRTL